MTHKEVYKEFERLFPQLFEHAEVWFPTGRHCIRVKMVDKSEIIFTFVKDADWRLETVSSFVKGLEG